MTTDEDVARVTGADTWRHVSEFIPRLSASKCQAVQVSDQMACRPCGLVWDMNDPEPPACGQVRKFRAVSRFTGETIAVGPIRQRVVDAAEILVGIGGFRVE
ncbi:MAG: hypothetical protein Unbinned3138contig1000_68 [Prokaryotic dsDNA virus sp.]|nr:MAG: hypothetical protein Unbinned3138contig1000_68 [Prokaryotic dsDNA virus sp.]|tara:strand:- start:3079 stop:3384 length:306 start_codon:yes stop_codon:yes gene_type:complete